MALSCAGRGGEGRCTGASKPCREGSFEQWHCERILGAAGTRATAARDLYEKYEHSCIFGTK